MRVADAPPTLGFLARICHDKGLHHLVEAFRILAADEELPSLRLRAAGYLGPADRGYSAKIQFNCKVGIRPIASNTPANCRARKKSAFCIRST